MKILFTGGGTGGHVFPLVAIIRELRRMYSKNDLELFYVGQKDEFGTILLSQEDVKTYAIFAGKIRRYFSLQNIVDVLFKFPLGLLQSFFLLLKIRPKIVFSKGGSGSVCVTFAAMVLRIPIFIHESDIVPGSSNRLSSGWAKKVFISFPKTEFFDLKNTILTGNPTRKEILDGDIQVAKSLFNLTLQKPVLLILGGSLGASAINDFVLNNLNELLTDFEIIHCTGKENLHEVENESIIVINKDLKKYYHTIGFLDQAKIMHAYKAADFIISRAGAGSIFEIAVLGKPSILIPLPGAAGDHQSKNAYAYSQAGACLVIEQQNLIKNFFLDKLKYLFLHKEKLEQMSTQALRFSKPLAAKAIAREILEYLMVE